jgi:hypothetical protein
MNIEIDNKNLNLILEVLKKHREYCKTRLKEEHLYYDEYLSDKIYRIDNLIEELGNIG